MNYISLEDYKQAWVFRHRDLPVPQEDLAQIKPLSPARAAEIWNNLVSHQTDHPAFFRQGDWPNRNKTWQQTDNWQAAWEADAPEMPDFITTHCRWDDNTVVYFCHERNHVLETTWAVFKRHWKNFLFMDDGPILLGKKRREAVQFLQNGNAKVGYRD